MGRPIAFPKDPPRRPLARSRRPYRHPWFPRPSPPPPRSSAASCHDVRPELLGRALVASPARARGSSRASPPKRASEHRDRAPAPRVRPRRRLRSRVRHAVAGRARMAGHRGRLLHDRPGPRPVDGRGRGGGRRRAHRLGRGRSSDLDPAASTVDVRVAGPGGSSGIGTADRYTFVAPATTPSTSSSTPVLAPTKPSLTGFSESASRWRRGRGLPQISSAGGVPLGTTFSFSLNEPGHRDPLLHPVRAGPSRQRQVRCPLTRQRGQAEVQARGERRLVFLAGHAGLNKVRFQGRLSSARTLKPGTYASRHRRTRLAWPESRVEVAELHDHRLRRVRRRSYQSLPGAGTYDRLTRSAGCVWFSLRPSGKRRSALSGSEDSAQVPSALAG